MRNICDNKSVIVFLGYKYPKLFQFYVTRSIETLKDKMDILKKIITKVMFNLNQESVIDLCIIYLRRYDILIENKSEILI